ncbi:phosphodiester glycosidase family protein [Aestuariivirga litoralis]|uniref:phosphodiester glycosidase family protein n=1 Tax=Aestuariivirga litoralis TaxID=2650924 RepID=UPI0018C72AC9|nr:phosphodiester glycosidase family protein [Aestuariivirga litoralis]MBG1233524.1 hypothetical protein [Aestuariivirga litoralis]
MTLIRLAVAALLTLAFAASASAECKGMSRDGQNYTVCTFDTRKEKISIFNLDGNGQPYGSFLSLERGLEAQGQKLWFAMNGGMFGNDLKPVGLYVEGGKVLHKINRRNGAGNFHMKPNGVFYVAGQKAGVMESDAFIKSGIKPDYATQSGPMLVINGAIHPKISASGTSMKIRNGVGMIDDHTIAFVISDGFVTFHEFAALFLDGLKCKNALFLDGSVSSLYAPEIGRSDFLAPLGPMVAVTAAQ